MATTENGWTAIESGTDPRLSPFPWVTGRVLVGDVFTVLAYVARRFDAEVEAVDPASSWGWAYRVISGSGTLSNHASGTAIDLNAPRHPLGAEGTFTAAQQSAIRSILDATNPVVRWGGGAAYTRKDEMHFEINEGITPATVAEVAARITPTPDPEDDMTQLMLIQETGSAAIFITDLVTRRKVLNTSHLQVLQRRLDRWGIDSAVVEVADIKTYGPEILFA
ncbi:M15 family metallopeptidase [Cellulomonas sp. SLBN-39]|uniref:M15 family metallopeptidase n=1 Tax=Cellulomonas sp. SLBN-39 TaxID=2768446 RepID=UPI0011511231|nr:M15 family metallopeptidase [Cellulomonas sp. SLBN-39]TQL03495.1 D-alanyl-D-alanine carboxypeptidase-like protein [Cellulomonas sp. SLBN-39]